ncbi:MAG: GHKL domain-containing protein [Cytophagales bacterium]|nr:MAG: GHKL domain-containing protein [Cytophagales bacterium]
METKKIPFTVTARTARLIGRENVTNAEGAVIELVKNGYDADGRVCLVYIDNRYHKIPSSLTTEEYQLFCEETKHNSLISKYYEFSLIAYNLKNNIPENILSELRSFFRQKNVMYIFDNGVGMTDDIILKQWMKIGTANKLDDYESELGRVKAGAKGIGRFALDRLGSRCKMFTFPKNKEKSNSLWEVNWEDFEKQNATIQEVTANLTTNIPKQYADILQEEFSATRDSKLQETLTKYDFRHGTLFKISGLRDEWHEKAMKNLFSSLEILTPPNSETTDTENNKFAVFLYSTFYENYNGKVNHEAFDDYDYKLFAEYLADEKHTIRIHIWRNEINKQLLLANKDIFEYPDMKQFPFDRKTIEKGDFEQYYTVFDLLKGEQTEELERLVKQLGKFDFTFYFLKGSIGKGEDRLKFYFREFNASQRREWLSKFGGIRIYRDNFRVRPYGEPNTSAYDWLQLGEKSSGLSVVAKKYNFKVRPNQVTGIINISRIYNENLADKSGREGLQENETFALFKDIVDGIIKIFEDDRSTIAYNLDKLYKSNRKAEELKEKAELALEKQKIADQRNENLLQGANIFSNFIGKIEKGEKPSENEIQEAKNAFEQSKTFQDAYIAIREEVEEKDEELKLMRSLASAGLMIAGFAHEFNRLSKELNSQVPFLIDYTKRLIPEDKLATLRKQQNPILIAEEIQELHNQLETWISFAFGITQKERRKRKLTNLNAYFDKFIQTWTHLLADRYVNITFTASEENIYLKIFEIDFNTIFENLLINSIEAFQKTNNNAVEKSITIELIKLDNQISINYRDTGTGLSPIFKDPYLIFRPFETTKKDDLGNDTGTGLGMWLLKSTVDEYKGEIKLLEIVNGFALNITFEYKN